VNFIFLASAKLMYPDSLPYSALVRVHSDADGAKIVKIVPHGSPSPRAYGAYSPFTKVSKKELDVLDSVKNGLIGASFSGEYVSTQLVAGFNYKFAGTMSVTLENPAEYPALLTVHEPLSGAPVITGIERVFNLV
jgi:hypothetical protein